MTLLSYDQILTTFEKPEDFQKLLTGTPKSDYGQLQKKILKTLNEMADEFINIKKDPKTLLNNLDRITKVFSELFSKKTTNRDGLSLLLESTLLITKRMSQWTVTRHSCSLHRKWLLIGGVYAELKLSSQALELMTEFLLLLEESKKTYTEKEYEYFEKTITHATFIKIQCFEDLKLLQSHQPEFISTYQQWFNSSFQYSDKPQLYHDALSIKFYNKTVYFIQSIKSIGSGGNIAECNTLLYHCNLVAWKSLAMTRNTVRFFDRLVQFLVAIQKNGYQNESNCWKLIKDIIMLIKSEMFITMLSQSTLEPSFITSLSMISVWSVTTKNTSNSLLQECNEITNEYIKSKKESKEILRLYSSELIIIQLFSWVTRCIILVNKIKSSSSNISPSEIIEFERELKATLISIHTTTEKSLMTTEFLIDNSNPTNTVDSKFIYFKLLGQLLNSLIEQNLMNSPTQQTSSNNTTINPQIKNQIQLFSQYYLLIPSLVIKWIQQFEQKGKLLPAKQMQPTNLLNLEDFIRSYLIASIENFKRFQGSISQDFKLQFNDINRDLITISLEYSSSISFLEELSSYLFMLGSQFNNKLVSHDYDSAIFYFESSIKILNKLISIGKSGSGNTGSNNIEKHFESLSISFFYLSQIHLKIKNYLKSHQYSIESIKSFLREKRSFTDVIHNNNFSNGNGGYNGITKRRLSIQEILKHFATTQYSLFKDINKSYNANENVLLKFNGISFINDIVTIDDGNGSGSDGQQQQSQDLEFKIQLFDMALSNFNQIITSSNGHQLMNTQIDRILNVLVSDKHPILHGRFLMEKAKLLRFYNPMKQDIEFIFQQSIELIKSTNLEQDKPFESAIFNELAKVHFWRAITNVEIHQNQCKDILKFLNDEKNRTLSSNTTPIASPITESSSSSSSSAHSLDHLETISTLSSSSSSSSTFSSKSVNTNGSSNGSGSNGSNSTTSSYSIENELFSSNNSICNFIKSTDQNRFRSPIGSENSIISKEFKLSLNLWSKILETLIKPVEKLSSGIPTTSATSTKDIETNLKSFISPHTTLSLLYSISDIYSFEGDYVSSIFTLKLVIGFVKCLFSNNSLCYLTEISKCYNTIASHFLEMKNTFKANHYLELNKQLISTFQSILVSEKLESFQITYQIHHFELQYTNLNGSNSQLEIDHVSNEIIKLYEYCLKHINRFEISLFMKISKIVSNIYIAQTNSAMAFTVSNKLIQCIFTAMPIESIDLIKGQKKQFKIDQQKDNEPATTSTTSNSSITSSIDNREIGMLQVTTSSKWSSLKICLDSLLHISSIFELRGRPKEAQYYYERGLLIGIIYGSIKVTCEFLTEIGELFYSKQKYVDSKINLDLVLFLISRHTINGNIGGNNNNSYIIEPSLLKTMILSNMLLGDLYRKQLLISQSIYHYNKSLSLINNLYNDENQLLSKFNSFLNITNDSTPKESRLIKLLSSKSLISKIKSRQSILNGSNRNNEVEEIKSHLSSFELRIKGKLARLLISQNKFTLAIETLEQLINNDKEEDDGDDGATSSTSATSKVTGGKYCNDITLSILEFQLGRAYYSSVDSISKDEIWSRTITNGNNFKVHPSILSARELLVNSFNRVGKYNIIKLNSSICRHIALTTGQLFPFLTCHFINLSIGIKSRHDMQSIVHDEKKKPQHPNHEFIGIKESLFSWNGGTEIPNQLVDINFLKKLKSIYSTDLPIDWKTCSLTIEDNHLLIVKLISNQIPILVRSKIQSLDNSESFDINKSSGNGSGNQVEDEEYNQVIKSKLENDDEFGSEDELELELEENDDQDDESASTGGGNIVEDNFYSNKTYEINDGDSSNGSGNGDGSIKLNESLKIQYNIVDKIRSNLKIIDCENLFNNRENSTTDKKAWFLKRKTLEFEIGKVVDMVDSLFGVWKTLLIGTISNAKIKDKFDKIKDKTMETILSIAAVKKFDNVLFDCIFYGFPVLSERAIVDGIIELMNYKPLNKRSTSLDGHPNFNTILKIYNTIQGQVLKCYPVAPIQQPSPESVSSLEDITFEDYMELESTIPTTTTPNRSPPLSQLSKAPTLSSLSLLNDDEDDDDDTVIDNSTTTIENLKESFLYQTKQPLVLIVDKNLHFIPFESLESLNEMPLYRLPSFTFQRFLCFDKEKNCYSKTMPSIDPKSCYYLLNPSGGLEETQDYFASYFKRKFPEWKGLVDVVPDKQQYKSALENNDIFVYMGHGSGEQYYRGDAIQKLDKCAVAILMGCKSGLLEEQGDYEPTGIILDFLLAGSKSIIGNIFDVPTGDCDRLTKSFLNKWFFDLKSKKNQPLTIDISSAISFARKSCDWKYLVGGSCVCYGIPTLLKSFH